MQVQPKLQPLPSGLKFRFFSIVIEWTRSRFLHLENAQHRDETESGSNQHGVHCGLRKDDFANLFRNWQ